MHQIIRYVGHTSQSVQYLKRTERYLLPLERTTCEDEESGKNEDKMDWTTRSEKLRESGPLQEKHNSFIQNRLQYPETGFMRGKSREQRLALAGWMRTLVCETELCSLRESGSVQKVGRVSVGWAGWPRRLANTPSTRPAQTLVGLIRSTFISFPHFPTSPSPSRLRPPSSPSRTLSILSILLLLTRKNIPAWTLLHIHTDVRTFVHMYMRSAPSWLVMPHTRSHPSTT